LYFLTGTFDFDILDARILSIRRNLQFRLILALINCDIEVFTFRDKYEPNYFSHHIKAIMTAIRNGDSSFLRVVEEQALLIIPEPPVTIQGPLPDAPREICIAVVGQTGTGKSRFINLVTGSHLEVGESLSSCMSYPPSCYVHT
jgi:hypothetical protein